jgi:type I restriction enzyme S subunit
LVTASAVLAIAALTVSTVPAQALNPKMAADPGITGTTIKHLTGKAIAALDVPCPPIDVQLAMADVLKTLDDRITLLRETNTTLEAIAQALFKSWFVDFDPVHAKMQGRAPEGMDEATAALFPDSFEESELGAVPKGWKTIHLEDAIELNPTRRIESGTLATHLEMADMPTSGHFPLNWTKRAVGSGMKFRNGDTLLARITPCLENGKTCFVDFLENDEVAWGSTEYIVMRSKPPYPQHFSYLLARSELFRDFAIAQMTGSSGRQRVPAETLKRYLICNPGTRILEAFGSIVSPLFYKARNAALENRTLAQCRDALLPRLLAGSAGDAVKLETQEATAA